MVKKIINLIFVMLFCLTLCSSAFSKKTETFNIKASYPNVASQGDKDKVLTLLLETPIFDRDVKLKVKFSNKDIVIKEIKFTNAVTIKCVVDIDENANIKKPNNLIIKAYKDKNMVFEITGTELIKISRKPFIEKIKVKTKTGKIVRGEKAKIVIYGRSFLKGEVGITLGMSGLDKRMVKCGKEKKLVLRLSKFDTIKLARDKYAISLSNEDGSFYISEEIIEVTD